MCEIILLILIIALLFVIYVNFDKLDLVYEKIIPEKFRNLSTGIDMTNTPDQNIDGINNSLKKYKNKVGYNNKNNFNNNNLNNNKQNENSVLNMNKYNTTNTKDLKYYENDTLNQSNINEDAYDVVNQIDKIKYYDVKTGIEKCKEECDGICFELGYTGSATCYPKQKTPFDYGTLYKNPQFNYGTNAYKPNIHK